MESSHDRDVSLKKYDGQCQDFTGLRAHALGCRWAFMLKDHPPSFGKTCQVSSLCSRQYQTLICKIIFPFQQ
uniref:Uncharacterized protein n=1 Tax=Spironucleus salmonicida TaxID=348837 RepID=V6LCC8_9EUKA|eukprot:EST41893.1 Hypothetical protein SS50377_18196 [Spironucleus salmonicida]